VPLPQTRLPLCVSDDFGAAEVDMLSHLLEEEAVR
jgi:hypothetical protein